jgi:hypothetical protein
MNNSRSHGKKTDKQLETYLKSANPNSIQYLFAIMERQSRIESGKWTRNKQA